MVSLLSTKCQQINKWYLELKFYVKAWDAINKAFWNPQHNHLNTSLVKLYAFLFLDSICQFEFIVTTPISSLFVPLFCGSLKGWQSGQDVMEYL